MENSVQKPHSEELELVTPTAQRRKLSVTVPGVSQLPWLCSLSLFTWAQWPSWERMLWCVRFNL